jgi:VWFA-related protein
MGTNAGTNGGWVFGAALTTALATVTAQEPVFRSSVDLVTVDATVVTSDGRPMSDLTAGDFHLSVDGQPRRIVSAQFVSLSVTDEHATTLRASHFTSNQTTDEGRLMMVAVDEAHIRRLEGRTALRAASAFLDTLDPRDRVAVTGLTRIGVIEFTRDRAVAKRRLDGLVGQTDPVFLQHNLGLIEALEVADGSRARLGDVVLRECGRTLTSYTSLNRAADDAGGGRDACPEQLEQEARAVAQHARTQARISLSALEALVESLATIEGPKTLVLLSEGLVADPRLLDFAELAAAAQAARVSIYVLHMEQPLFEAAQARVSPTFLQDQQVRGDGLGRLAGSARGAMFRLVGSDPRPFERIRREIEGYYLLAFEPQPTDRDGQIHRIAVSLARGGADVRARPAFRMPLVVPSARAREEELVDLLRASRPSRELPVRVATYTYVEPGSPRLRVVVSTESDAAGGPAAQVLLGYVLIDGKGVIAASAAHRSDTGRHAFSTLVTPGDYTLRVAAIDPLGRRGSLERPFTAALAARDGVRISDVILAPPPPSPDQPLEPTVDRVTGSEVVAYVELYADEGGPLRDAHVRVEVAASDVAPALVTAAAEVVRRDARWATARAVVPLDAVPPGRYLARLHISANGRPVTTIVRPFLRTR